MRELVALEGLSRAEWLVWRRRGIGASDAAAALGVSKWVSPLRLYLDKRGEVVDDTIKEPKHFVWGRKLEEVVASAYAEETGRVVKLVPSMLQHDSIDWMLAEPDRFIEPRDGVGPGVLECKTSRFGKPDDWEGEPPIAYQIQVQHQLAVTGYTWGSIAVLFGGSDFRWYDVGRADRFIDMLIVKEADFWRRVQEGDPPMVGFSESDAKALALLYPEEVQAKVMVLPPEAGEWDYKLKEAAKEVDAAEQQRTLYRNKIKEAMKDAEYGMLPDGTGRYHWRTVSATGYEVKPRTYRALRRVS